MTMKVRNSWRCGLDITIQWRTISEWRTHGPRVYVLIYLVSKIYRVFILSFAEEDAPFASAIEPSVPRELVNKSPVHPARSSFEATGRHTIVPRAFNCASWNFLWSRAFFFTPSFHWSLPVSATRGLLTSFRALIFHIGRQILKLVKKFRTHVILIDKQKCGKRHVMTEEKEKQISARLQQSLRPPYHNVTQRNAASNLLPSLKRFLIF